MLQIGIEREPGMNANSQIEQSEQSNRIVLVVGVDMSNVTEHLLSQTCALIRSVDEAEVHVVHVVSPEPPFLRVVRPSDAKDAGVAHDVERAQSLLDHLSDALKHNPRTRVFVHTPVGAAADELARVATEVGADILVVEAHEHDGREPLRVFHRSLVDHIASTAPCTVLTIRKPRRPSEESMFPAERRPDATPTARVG
jgi:nucleotide-binding universal stress UspA family protein